MYLTSAGNTSAMGNAKGVITDAIIGLVLAISAWFLLNFINPDLLSGDLTSFDNLGIDVTEGDDLEASAQTVGGELLYPQPAHVAECLPA